MSPTPTPTSHHRRVRRRSAVVLVVGLIGLITVACTPTAPTGPSALEQFCAAWDRVEAAPPTAERPVLVADDVVAKAESSELTGAECTDPGAAVELDEAVLAPGQEVDESQGDPESGRMAVVTGPELGAESAVDALTFDNLRVTGLSASIGVSGIQVSGTLAVTLSGTTSVMAFSGTLADLQNWSVTLSSGAFSLPGITTGPASFSGTLRSSFGVQSLSLQASVPEAVIGDVRVNDALVEVTASPATGVVASVSGSVEVGPSTATGTVHVEFDDRGNLVQIDAELDARLVGFQGPGSSIDLQGTVSLHGNAESTVATLSASGRIGDLVVNRASGELLLENNRVTLTGSVDADISGVVTRLDATVVWDGVIAVADLRAEAAGKYTGFLDDGTLVSVEGQLTTETGIGGITTTVVTGDFRIGNLFATGQATVAVQDSTTTIEVIANVSGSLAPISANAQLIGVIEIVDGDTTLIDLQMTADSIVFGELTLRDARLSVTSSGFDDPLEITVDSEVIVEPSVIMDARLTALFDADGGFVSLTGTATGGISVGGVNIRDIQARLSATPESVTVTATTGTVNFGPLTVTGLGGVFTADPVSQDWRLTVNADLSLFGGFISLPSGRLTIQPATGQYPTGVFALDVTARVTLLGVTHSARANLQLAPDGSCDLQVYANSNLVQWIMLGELPKVLPCSVGGPILV